MGSRAVLRKRRAKPRMASSPVSVPCWPKQATPSPTLRLPIDRSTDHPMDRRGGTIQSFDSGSIPGPAAAHNQGLKRPLVVLPILVACCHGPTPPILLRIKTGHNDQSLPPDQPNDGATGPSSIDLDAHSGRAAPLIQSVARPVLTQHQQSAATAARRLVVPFAAATNLPDPIPHNHSSTHPPIPPPHAQGPTEAPRVQAAPSRRPPFPSPASERPTNAGVTARNGTALSCVWCWSSRGGRCAHTHTPRA